jgi:hypothetical protein
VIGANIQTVNLSAVEARDLSDRQAQAPAPVHLPQSSRPRCLLVGLAPATGPARIAKPLHNAGFAVAALSPAGHYLAHTRYVDEHFRLPPRAQRWLPSSHGDYYRLFRNTLILTVQRWGPDLVIPGDDIAAQWLRDIALDSDQGGERTPGEVREVLEFSMGREDHYGTIMSKLEMQFLARDAGLLTPGQRRVDSLEDLLQFGDAYGYPVVLKYEYSTGGDGTHICDSPECARRIYRDLHSRGISARQLKQMGRSLVGDIENTWWHASGGRLHVQQFIAGKPGSCCLVAVEGETLASFATVSEVVHPPIVGQSAIVRFTSDTRMAEAASKLVYRLGYTGFACFDFVVPPDRGRPYFLECNPRPTPTAHLGGRVGVDLATILFASLTDRALPPPVAGVTEQDVAIFPHVWRVQRDRSAVSRAILDAPWDDPMLMRALVSGGGPVSRALRGLKSLPKTVTRLNHQTKSIEG